MWRKRQVKAKKKKKWWWRGWGEEKRYMRAWVFCCVQLFVTSWTITHQVPPSPWDSPGKNTGVDCHVLLQRIFLNQGCNLHFLHWHVDSLPLCHIGGFGQKDEDEKNKRKNSFLIPSCQAYSPYFKGNLLLKLINLTVPDLLWFHL